MWETADLMHQNRKYHVNTHYFETINTEGKAYWLGFLYADGSVHSNKPVITLSLAKRDKDHLTKFKRHLNSGHPIKPVNGLMSVGIGSVSLKSDLIRLGVKPNKSTTGSPCLTKIPLPLRQHFWRGVFDGDGWVCYNGVKGRNKGHWQVGLCGTLETVVEFYDYIYTHLGVSPYIDHRDLNKNFARVSYNSLEAAKAVTKLLYSNSTVFLSRKLELVRELDLYQPPYINSVINTVSVEHLLQSYELLGSWNKVASSLGVSGGYMTELRTKKGMR
jgi:hypothetical protein